MIRHNFLYIFEDDINENGELFVEVHLLVGPCRYTIKNFKEMANDLRETFPQALEEDIECGKVYASEYAKGFAIVCWKGYIEIRDYPGWLEKTIADYYW